jgi:hypothetical protein
MNQREYVLAELRCAALRSRLVTAELDTIGVALKHNLVTPEDAVRWLHEVGLDHALADGPAPAEAV